MLHTKGPTRLTSKMRGPKSSIVHWSEVMYGHASRSALSSMPSAPGMARLHRRPYMTCSHQKTPRRPSLAHTVECVDETRHVRDPLATDGLRPRCAPCRAEVLATRQGYLGKKASVQIPLVAAADDEHVYRSSGHTHTCLLYTSPSPRDRG